MQKTQSRKPAKMCIRDRLKERSRGNNYTEIEKEGQRFMAVFSFSGKSGWGVIELIPVSSFFYQKVTLMGTAVALVFLVTVVGIVLSFYLSKNFTKPLEMVSRCV